MDLQVKYEELIRIREKEEKEAAAKEELTQDLRAELEAVKAQQAKEHAEHQEAMAQVTAFAKSLPAEGDTVSRVLANEVVAGREQALVSQATQAMEKKDLRIAEGEFRMAEESNKVRQLHAEMEAHQLQVHMEFAEAERRLAQLGAAKVAADLRASQVSKALMDQTNMVESQTSVLRQQEMGHQKDELEKDSLRRKILRLREEGQALMDQLQQRLAQPQSIADLGALPAVTIPTTAMPGGVTGPAVFAQPIESQGSMLAQLLTQVNQMKAPASYSDSVLKTIPRFVASRTPSSDVRPWIDRFTDTAEAEGWLDQSMDLKSKLIKVVDDTTYSWLGTLDRSLLNSLRWPDFKEAFLRRFGRTKADALRELMTRKQGERESVRSFGEAFRMLCQEAYVDCNSDQSMELLRAGLIPALGYDLALAARPGDFYTLDTLLEHLTQLERNEQRYRGQERAHHDPDSVTYSQRPGRSGAKTEQIASAPAYSAPSPPVSYPQAPPARSTGYQGKSAWAGGGRGGGNQGPQASASSGPAINNNSGNGQPSSSAQGPQGAQGAQPMEVGYIGRTATIQIIPSTDLEEEAVHESVTAAASRPEGEPVAAVGLGITPTIFDHMQSKMRGSDLLSQFPQERKRLRMVGRTRFLNSQAGPSPSEPAAQGNGSSGLGGIYPKSGVPANKPWVQPAPTAPKSLPSLAATPSAKVEPGIAGKSATLNLEGRAAEAPGSAVMPHVSMVFATKSVLSTKAASGVTPPCTVAANSVELDIENMVAEEDGPGLAPGPFLVQTKIEVEPPVVFSTMAGAPSHSDTAFDIGSTTRFYQAHLRYRELLAAREIASGHREDLRKILLDVGDSPDKLLEEDEGQQSHQVGPVMDSLKEFRNSATRRVSEMRTQLNLLRSSAVVDHAHAHLCITRIVKQARFNLEEIDCRLEAAACQRDVRQKDLQRAQRNKILEQASNDWKLQRVAAESAERAAQASLTAVSAASPLPQWSTIRTSRSSKLASGSTSVPKTEALGGRAEHLASRNVQKVDVCAPAALALEPAFSGVMSKGISRTFEWPGELATKFLPELTGLGLQFALSMVKFYHQPFLHFIFGKTFAGTEETSDGLLWWLPSRSRTWQESRSLSNTDDFSVRRISTAPLLKTPAEKPSNQAVELMFRGGLLNQSLTSRSASSRSDGLVRALDTRSINCPELLTSQLVIIHDLPDRLDNPLDSDSICQTQARPPVDRDKGELAIRSSELSPLQPGFAAADRTDPPDRLVGTADSKALCSTGSYTRPPVDRDKGELAIRSSELSPLQPGIAAADRTDPPDRLSGSVDSKALCSTGSYARPLVERDKSDSGRLDAERLQVPLIFTAAGSVDSQDLLVSKLALDHTFGSQGRPPVERDKTKLTIWKGDDRETCFFEENGAPPSTARIPKEVATPFEGDPVGGPSASGE